MFEEKFLEPHFTSVLAPYMLDVVEQKRALGNKYNAGVEALSAFDDFCNEQQLRILRTALGHDRITTTEKYLRLVPEAYMEVTEPFNDRFHTITEVLCNEE